MTEETDEASRFLGTHLFDRSTPTQRPRNAGERPACEVCAHWDCDRCGHRHQNQSRAYLAAGLRACVACGHHSGGVVAVYHRYGPPKKHPAGPGVSG